MGEALKQANERFFANPEEYLEWEEKATYKSEYRQGEVTAMAGGSLNHNTISGNIFGNFFAMLKGKGCRPFNSDMKLDIPLSHSFVYPDAMVVCGTIELMEGRQDVVKNPTLIVEVMSPSTADYDRGEKFVNYRSLAMFKEYLLVDSRRYQVDAFFRKSPQEWQMLIYQDLSETVLIQSLGLKLPMSDIYTDVVFE